MPPLLEVDSLSVSFMTDAGPVRHKRVLVPLVPYKP